MSEQQVLPPRPVAFRITDYDGFHGSETKVLFEATSANAYMEAIERALAQSEAERERLQGELSAAEAGWTKQSCLHAVTKFELARERELNRWRDCKQELPHFGERVLAYSPANKHQGRRYFVTSLHVYSGKKDMIWLDGDINEWATHWMPLPDPPALHETIFAPPTDPKPNAEEGTL